MTSIEDKLAFMNMTLDDKIKRTKQLIMEWYAQFDGEHVLNEYLKCDAKHQEPTMF